MKLRMTGRHMEVTSALRRYLETRFDRLDRYGLKLGTVQVILSVEKLQHKAEAVCTVNGKQVQAKISTREMYATIDALVDRLDAQLRKLKDRLVSHKPAKSARPRTVRGLEAPVMPAPELVVQRQVVPTLALDQVSDRMADHAASFMVFVHAERGTVHVAHRLADGEIAVMEPYQERAPSKVGRRR